jgi:hypothetical protein
MARKKRFVRKYAHLLDPKIQAKAAKARARNAKLRKKAAKLEKDLLSEPKVKKPARKKYTRRHQIQTDHLRQSRDPRTISTEHPPQKATPQSPEGRAAIATARLLVQQACILLLTVE